MKKTIKITIGIIIGIILMFFIDFICILKINKPLLAIKEDNGDSVNLIYRGLFYDTYICHEYTIPQIKSKGTKFSCAVIIIEEEIEEKYEPTKIDGITMTIKEGTLTNKNATIIIRDTNGKGKYVYGTAFRIDKKINGKWYKLETTNNNCAFTMKAYYVDDNGHLEFNQDWTCLHKKLEKGIYRLVKSTFLESDTPITEDDHKYFSVEFTIK